MTAPSATSLERLPWRVRLPLFLTLGATTELCCIALDCDFTDTLEHLGQAVLLCAVMLFFISLVSSAMSSSRRQVFGYGLSLVIVLLAMFVSDLVHTGVSSLCLTGIAGVVTLFRYQRLYTGTAIAGVHLQFSIDTGILVLVCVYFGLGLVIGALPFGPAMSGFFAVLALAEVLAWMYVMWALERVVSGTQRARRGGIVVLLGFALICGLFGLKALYYSLLFVLGTGALLFIPLMHAPKLNILLKAWKNVTGQVGKSPSAKQFHAPPPLVSPQVMHVAAVVVSVLAMAALLYFIFRRRVNTASIAAEEAPLQVMERRSAVTDNDLFLPTDDAIRLRLQQWLRTRLRAGQRFRQSDTARTWAEDGDPAAELVRNLLADYEDSRYRH
jgi:hypothetical protein